MTNKMEVIKLGKKGQVSIPQSILAQLGLSSETLFQVETTNEGAILLQPTEIYPIEIYGQQRLDSFAEEDTLTDEESRKIAEKLGKNLGNATVS
jgi:AbrB family looped-hinge helix DNA binding protein